MRHHLCGLAAVALVAFSVGASPAAAQSMEWGSETNRTWWNGVTEAELRELVAEAGGTWLDLPDTDTLRESRIDWPDLKGVRVREGACPRPERAMAERNCGITLLYLPIEYPADIESWWLDNDGWLAFGGVDSAAALYRLENHAYGTTRGRVLSMLVMFHTIGLRETARMRGEAVE